MSLSNIYVNLVSIASPLKEIFASYFKSYIQANETVFPNKTKILKEYTENFYNETFYSTYKNLFDFSQHTSLNNLYETLSPTVTNNMKENFKSSKENIDVFFKTIIFNIFCNNTDEFITDKKRFNFNNFGSSKPTVYYDIYEIENLISSFLNSTFSDFHSEMMRLHQSYPVFSNFLEQYIYRANFQSGHLNINNLSKLEKHYYSKNFTSTKFSHLQVILKSIFNIQSLYDIILFSRAYGIKNGKQNLEFFCKIFPYSQKIQQIIPDVKITKREQSEPKKKRNFFGIELEFSSKESVRNIIMKTNQDLWYILKSDSSISGKYSTLAELVTVPMSMGAAKHYFAQFFKNIPSENFDNSKETTNGIHIHISLNNFRSNNHRMIFKNFFNNSGNFLFIKNISERSEDKLAYCNFAYQPYLISNVVKFFDYETVNDRNLPRHGRILEDTKNTIELRIFKGFANYFTINKALDFTSSILEYTRHIDETYKNHIEKIMYGRSLEHYLNWLNNTPLFEYKTLKKTLKNKKDSLDTSIKLAKIIDVYNPALLKKHIDINTGEFKDIPFSIKNFDMPVNFNRDIPLSEYIKKRISQNSDNILNFYNLFNSQNDTIKAVEVINEFFEFEKISIIKNTTSFKWKINSNKNKDTIIISDDSIEKEELAIRDTTDEVVNFETTDPWSV